MTISYKHKIIKYPILIIQTKIINKVQVIDIWSRSFHENDLIVSFKSELSLSIKRLSLIRILT